MSVAADNSGAAGVEVLPRETPRQPALSQQDLAELFSAVNDVTSKLQVSHEKLHAEVARLTRELAEANAQIARSQRLAALGEMAAGIAHEVRNPLGSIRLYARMLEQDLPTGGESHGVAGKIGRSVTAIEQIVGDVLSFAREHRLSKQDVDVADLVTRSIEACAPQAHPAWKSVRVETRAGVGDSTIGADAGLLQQALVNVIRNAMEAMEEAPAPVGGHRLRVSVEERDEVGGKRVPAIAIIVQDSGPGVTPEIVSRMFNPFFTTRSAGTGLGLSIVHRIIDAHGGTVRVRNNRDLASVGAGAGALATEPGASVELTLPRGASVTEERGEVVVRTAERVRA